MNKEQLIQFLLNQIEDIKDGPDVLASVKTSIGYKDKPDTLGRQFVPDGTHTMTVSWQDISH